ncbi:uncharacterized protein LOC103182521 [Callorhinchus milii]|uniref:uncharacterized protein LOC103182521 n=1 Tax=Callorhinchus milii TaxID=7868 RepID=UPI0004574400|nr:uncharacterized protein LOC103182521 [Callorhinchus milii]|eukprot:gi/632963249/ref/XP_007897775.1/ PREDICTED: uncharacterized protein LOC103182521 [Callorhinchus milii]
MCKPVLRKHVSVKPSASKSNDFRIKEESLRFCLCCKREREGRAWAENRTAGATVDLSIPPVQKLSHVSRSMQQINKTLTSSAIALQSSASCGPPAGQPQKALGLARQCQLMRGLLSELCRCCSQSYIVHSNSNSHLNGASL